MSLVEDRLAKVEERTKFDPLLRADMAPFLAAGFVEVGDKARAEVDGRYCEVEQSEVVFGTLAHPERRRVPL